MNLAQQYIDDVLNDRVVVCEYVRLSVQRHANDLAKSVEQSDDFPFYFDSKVAAKAIELAKLFRLTKGEFAGEFFDLQPYQAFILWCLFGWKHRKDHTRRFRKAYLEIARKNGKTSFSAVICHILTWMDGENGAECFMVATTYSQAEIAFKIASQMATYLRRDSKAMRSRLTVRKRSIYSNRDGSFMRPMAATPEKLDGPSPHVGYIDEYHEHKTDKLLKVFETGMGGRLQPLILITTTAGFNKTSPCYLYRKTVIGILKGIVTNDATFGIIFTLDENDDWQDENNWIKANPNIGKAPYWKYMREQYVNAVTEGSSAEVQFKTKNLNIWTDSAEVWIQDQVWIKGATNFDSEELVGRMCWSGIDLATKRDLCAMVLLFPPEGDEKKFKVLCEFWCPEETAKERDRLDGVPYLDWARNGWLTLTKGNAVDHEYIARKIIEAKEKFDIQTVGYDDWSATQFALRLAAEGFNMSAFSQSFKNMNEPVKWIETMTEQGLIDHGNHPVLRWMVSNVEIQRDASDHVRLSKKLAREKIDGCVALAEAVGEYLTDTNQGGSIYETRGIIEI